MLIDLELLRFLCELPSSMTTKIYRPHCGDLNQRGAQFAILSPSGKAMMHQLHRESFDLLILDWHVPDLNGTEILKWVREKLSTTLPVLFMTSRSGEDDIVAGLAAGADDYMIKPIRRAELVARTGLVTARLPKSNRERNHQLRALRI